MDTQGRYTQTPARSTIVGLFSNLEDARDAIEGLKNAGFTSSQISILARDREDTRDLAKETGTEAASGAATGAVGGGILGGIAGWLVGVGALVIPGIGPFIAAGALGTALAGAAIGAGVGAVAGALVGMGIPKEEAEWYEGEVKTGRTLVAVTAGNRNLEAQRILREYGAYDIEHRQPQRTIGMTTTGGRMGTSMTDDRYTTSTARSTEGNLVGGGRYDDEWRTVMPQYRSRWEARNQGTTTGRWEDYEPGYRYGWEMWRNDKYRGRNWTEVEPEFRRDWETRYHDKPWDRSSDSVRDAWDWVSRGDSSYSAGNSMGSGRTGNFNDRPQSGEKVRYSPDDPNFERQRDPYDRDRDPEKRNRGL